MAKNLSVIFNMVDNISAKLSSAGSAGRSLASSFQSIEDSANAGFESMNSAMDAVAASLDSSSSAASALASSIGSCSATMAGASSTADGLASASGLAGEALADTADAVERASREIEELGDTAEEAGEQSESFGSSSANAIGTLSNLLVSAGIVEGIHKIGEAFAECAAEAEVVETSLAKLQTIAGGENIGALSTDIVALSNEMGQSAEGLADVAYNAISAGTAVEGSVEMAETATKLATAGFTDSASALSVLETAMNSYGDAAGSAEHISDTLIGVQNLGVTTVAELASQMGKAISTASAYNVTLENLESGYISITKAGINTAEGTTYISAMLNELGNSGSEVAKLLKEETGQSFGQLMNEGRSLADVLGMIYQSCDNNAEAMMNMWGSAEAGKAANAIIGQGLDTFNQNLTTLQTSAGATADAYAIMADTTEYAHNKMDNAAKNTEMQIGKVLNPTLEKLYEEMEEIYTGIGEFVKNNPVAVKAIAALAAGIAVFATGLAAYTAATGIATVVQNVFNASMMACPVVWLIGGVAALTAGLVMLATSYEETRDSTDNLTMASQEHKESLAALNTEYEEACQKYGENSDEASALALEIRNLEESYEHAEETVGEFQQRIENLGESITKTRETYDSNIEASDELYSGTTMLIGQLQALQNQTNLTDSQLTMMNQIVSQLNGSYSDLGLTIDETTGRTNFSTQDLFDFAHSEYQKQQMEAASQGLLESLGAYEEAKKNYDDALSENTNSWEKYEQMETQWKADHPVQASLAGNAAMNWSSELGNQFDQWQKSEEEVATTSAALNELNNNIGIYCETLGYSSEETETFIQQLQDGSLTAEESAVKFGESGEEMASYADAVSGGVYSVKTELDELAAAYDEAYNNALTNIEGQYALWDKVENKSQTSVESINEALQSQIDYWNDYASNLENLQGRDISGLSEMLKSMDDGSEESAAALSAMASATDEQLQSMVNNYQDLQSAQGQTADKMAELETDFGTALDGMVQTLTTSVEQMNMEAEASNAAKATLQGYINSINSMKGQAVSAAQAVAAATATALNTATAPATPSNPPSTLPGHTSPVDGYASGTTNSDKVYIAGEEGPELIISGGGDTVFPTSETDKIISAVNGDSDNEQVTAPAEMNGAYAAGKSNNNNDTGSGQDKTVTIKLEGSGAINVGAGTSPDSVWDTVKGNIKAAFISLLQEEVFEEGAGAYEF